MDWRHKLAQNNLVYSLKIFLRQNRLYNTDTLNESLRKKIKVTCLKMIHTMCKIITKINNFAEFATIA